MVDDIVRLRTRWVLKSERSGDGRVFRMFARARATCVATTNTPLSLSSLSISPFNVIFVFVAWNLASTSHCPSFEVFQSRQTANVIYHRAHHSFLQK